ASGSITNTGAATRSVPPILIVLRDARDRIVYSWEVQPPKRSLAPGETVTVNEAVTDVPRSAKFAEIGWKPSY
ncbi:MAG: thioredoxin, partial [Croceibacterium sp.]